MVAVRFSVLFYFEPVRFAKCKKTSPAKGCHLVRVWFYRWHYTMMTNYPIKGMTLLVYWLDEFLQILFPLLTNGDAIYVRHNDGLHHDNTWVIQNVPKGCCGLKCCQASPRVSSLTSRSAFLQWCYYFRQYDAAFGREVNSLMTFLAFWSRPYCLKPTHSSMIRGITDPRDILRCSDGTEINAAKHTFTESSRLQAE